MESLLLARLPEAYLIFGPIVDVLPIIPVFNLASALGVPFVDRTIRVGTLADAIVAGVAGDAEGVQRFAAMDELALEARA